MGEATRWTAAVQSSVCLLRLVTRLHHSNLKMALLHLLYLVCLVSRTTLTHTLRETTTSDVWVTEQTAITLTVTQTTTQWDFVPQYPQTVTSVIRVTSTPVVVETATVGVNPVSTMVSIYSQFVTTTDTVKYWQTITHVAVTHEIQTVPVVTTQELLQEIVTTVTHIVTTTVTSTTARYYA
ncbi:chondroitin proteoglycan 1-like isoform X3 [Procambarus clarkii]|uniref:chondroitin proteoglycan 1-like isoform X3 n=1 Tax=Procambarus clarkii TaxID=6728 RepID=UPI003742E601